FERANVVRALFPGEYDLGARLSGGWRFVRYALAVQNGEPLGERAFPGRDPNQFKDVVGRLGFEAPIAGPVTFAGGVSGPRGKGFHKGTAATKTGLVWQDRNEDGRFQAGEILVVPGVSAIPSENFNRHAFGVDARYGLALPRVGATWLYGEFMTAN